jgi:hypothetical protein
MIGKQLHDHQRIPVQSQLTKARSPGHAKKLYMVLQAPNLPSSLKTCTKNKSEICTNKQEVRLEP